MSILWYLIGLRIRLFHVLIKLFSCILYCVRVINDAGQLPFARAESSADGNVDANAAAADTTYTIDDDSIRFELLRLIIVYR